MLNIYLARHGQDEDNANGILNGHRNKPLTELGEKQAHTLGAHIKEVGLTFDRIYASPLKRAHTTAQIVAQILEAAEPIVVPELIERDFGVMSGEKSANIEKLCSPHIIRTDPVIYFLEAEGVETYPQALERAKKLLAHLQEEHESGNILLVTHGDFSKMMFAAYYNMPWEDALRFFHFGNSELVLLGPNTDPKDAHVFKMTQFNN